MSLAKCGAFLIPLSLGAVILWAYWFVLGTTVERWPSAEYSHGYFVPAFALALLWLRRAQILSEPGAPSWWGLVPLMLGSAVRVAAAILGSVRKDLRQSGGQ